jgi:hypothetical protein
VKRHGVAAGNKNSYLRVSASPELEDVYNIAAIMSWMDEPLFSRSALQQIQGFNKQKKCELINFFWPHLSLAEDDFVEEEYTELFRFIGKTLQEFQPFAAQFAFEDFQGLFDIIGSLRDNRASTRDSIAQKIKANRYSNYPDTKIIKSMELSLRLWLGLNVCSRDMFVGAINPRATRLNWKRDKSLDAMVDAHFRKRTNAVYMESQLDDFTAAKLKSVCRLNIEWTNSLNDHLRLIGSRGKRTLFIYQQKISLANHGKVGSPMIPVAILDEAISTLELLLPLGDPETKDFLSEVGKLSLYTTAPSEKPPAADLDEFDYWKGHLARLLNLLNGPPESFLQRLFDTRDLGQWAALWVGIFGILIFTLLFGILATVYAIKQYFLAVDSYNISLKSYELSLFLACQQNATLLPGLCG